MGPPFILGPVSKENVPLNNGFVDIITPPWDGFYITVRATLEIDHLDVAGANGGAIPRTQGEGDPNMPSYNDLFINPRLRKATMVSSRLLTSDVYSMSTEHRAYSEYGTGMFSKRV